MDLWRVNAMISRRFIMLCAGTVLVGACDEEGDVVVAPDVPLAVTRFVNAVPDTGATDWSYVDALENSPREFGMPFRGASPYQAVAPGTRHLRVFPTDTIAALTSVPLADEQVPLTADKTYTALLLGFARAGSTPAMSFKLIEDNPPDPGSRVALRVINATSAAIDVRAYPVGGTLPAQPTWANVPPLSESSFSLFDPDTIMYNVQPAGGGFPLFRDARALVGAQPAAGLDAAPGTTIAGSAVTGIVLPGSVVGSNAPQTSAFVFTTGTATLQATATGYTRASGSFITDGFLVGLPITASGFANPANNGSSVITAVTATALTVTKTPPPVVEKGTTGAIEIEATSTGYVRTTGSFIDDGFVVGQEIIASGFAEGDNNGRSVITAMTATTLTVTKDPQTVAETAASGRTIVNATARRIVGPPSGRPAINFVWDRRPPRT
jgi:hypothetical protein